MLSDRVSLNGVVQPAGNGFTTIARKTVRFLVHWVFILLILSIHVSLCL